MTRTLDVFGPPALRAGLGDGQLAVAVAVAAILLALAAARDLWRNRVVPEWLTLPFLAVAVAVAPLVYAHPRALLIPAAAMLAFSAILFFAGAQGGADAILYVGLAVCFGAGIFVVYMLSCLLFFLYALPWTVVQWRRGTPWKEAHMKPFVPGIAFAFPLALAAFGASAPELAALLGLQLLVLAAVSVYEWRILSPAARAFAMRPLRCPYALSTPDGHRYACSEPEGHSSAHHLLG